jgi:hypothetical protein
VVDGEFHAALSGMTSGPAMSGPAGEFPQEYTG